MKNQVLQTLLIIHNRLRNVTDTTTVIESIQVNNEEITFLAKTFQTSEEETILLAASCIYLTDAFKNKDKFNIKELSKLLEVEMLDILKYLKNIESLVEKGLLIKCPYEKDNAAFNLAIDVLNKEYTITQEVVNYLI
jgi:hypothetical protein